MKRFTFILILLIFGTAAFAVTKTWTGAISTNWDTATNWNPAGVPGSGDDVTIPNTTRQPRITWNYAICRDINIQAGSSLLVNSTPENYNFTVRGVMTVNGALNLTEVGAVDVVQNFYAYGAVSVTGTGRLTLYQDGIFYPGSSFTDSAQTQFLVHKNLTIQSGASFKMTHGGRTNFVGEDHSIIYNYSTATEFGYLIAAKTVLWDVITVTVHGSSTDFKINKDLLNLFANTFICIPNITITLLGDIKDSNSPETQTTIGIKLQAGTLKMDGTAYQKIEMSGPGCLLNNLTCSSTQGVVTYRPLVLKGNLLIEQGNFSVNGNNTVRIAGDWENPMGFSGFTEGTGRVIFNSRSTTVHQRVLSNETFHILEVDNGPLALRFASNITVSCTQYDWSSGGIDMNMDSTFNANDLADNAICGGWWLSNAAGTINIRNPAPGDFIDLKGDLHILSGNFNVYGASISYWPYQQDASIQMSGGTLDFHNTGIHLNPANVLTSNITGGLIRVIGGFTGTRTDFNPTGGTVEMYGDTNATVQLGAGSSFYNLKINKPTTSPNVATASSNILITNILTISAGTLFNNTYDINIGSQMTTNQGTTMKIGTGAVYVTGNLNCSGKIWAESTGGLTVYGDSNFWTGSSFDDSSQTQFQVHGNLTIQDGANFKMTHGGRTNCVGTNNTNIYNYSAATEFGYLIAAKTVSAANYYVNIHGGSTQPFKVRQDLINFSGNKFTCTPDITVTVLGKVEDQNASSAATTYGIKWQAGTLKMDGASQLIVLQGPGCFLNNLICSATTGVSSDYDLTIKGNLVIESGYFATLGGTKTIKIAGNWDNQVGTAGFAYGTGRVIFNSSDHQNILSNQTFNILEVDNGNGLRFASGKTVTCAVYDWTSGSIDVNTDATFTANSLADNAISGGWWLTHSGATINLTNTGWVDLKGRLHISAGNFNVYGGTTPSYWPFAENAYIEMLGGVLDFHNTGIVMNPTAYDFSADITGGLIRVSGGFTGTRPNFTPAGGTIELYGNTTAAVGLGTGSSFYNLKINQTAIVTAASNLRITNNLTLAAGKLDVSVNNYAIFIGGNWINEGGNSRFEQRTGTVTFNKVGDLQVVSGETHFSSVIDAHTGGALKFDGNTGVGTMTVTNIVHFNETSTITNVLNTVATGALSFFNDRAYNIGHYTGGGFLRGRPGSHVIIHDLTENGLYGAFEANAAHLEFHQDTSTGSWIDVNGDMTISAGGIVDIYGGSLDCYIGLNGNSVFTMSSGSFNVKDRGIKLFPSGYNCDFIVSGGEITCNGDWTDTWGIFDPTGGSVVMAGTGDNHVKSHANSWFWNLKVNKIASRDSSEPQFSYDRAGNQTPITRSSDLTIWTCTLKGGLDIQNANIVSLYGNMKSTNGGAINVGNVAFNLNSFSLTSTGDLALHANGLLNVNSGASLLMSGSHNINVNNAGALLVVGSSTLASKITGNGTGSYGLNVNSGGTLGASYAVFEYLTENGILLNAGSLVLASRSFDNCIFRNGVSSGTLLTLDNNQDLTIDGASFPTNSGGGAKNVTKTVNSGSVYFSNWTGDFGGPAFEQDSYNRINWQGSGAPQITDLVITYIPATNKVKLEWSYPQAATSYKIYRSLDPHGTFTWTANTTLTTWSEVVQGPKYFYKVTAVTP